MRKICGIIWLLLGAVSIGHAQRIVRGTVTEQNGSDKARLPGVTILLKGTNTGTATDRQGDFQLAVSRDTVTLLFSFVGFKPLEKKIVITRDTTTLPPIRLKEDCNLDFFYHKHVELSLLSGLRYTPLGGRLKAIYPYIIHNQYSMGTLRAELSYQLGNANYQCNATLALDNVFVDCNNNVDVTADYQRVQLGAQGFSYTRYSAGATYTGRSVSRTVPVYLAVGRLSYLAEGISAARTGVEAGADYPLSINLNSSYTKSLQLTPTGRIAYWQAYWQFQGSIEARINRFSVGVNVNRLGQYLEITTRAGFAIERRYHAKKRAS